MTGVILGYSPAVFAFFLATLLVASVLSTAAGFGLALLAVPTLSLCCNTKVAVVVIFLTGSVLSALMFVRLRAHVEWVEARRLSIGAFAGMPFGVYLLVHASTSLLRLLLGIAILIATVVLMLPRRTTRVSTRPATSYVVGALSGVLNTSLSTNGPPLVVYLRARNWESNTFRATLQVVFLASNVVGLVMLIIGHAVHVQEVELTAVGLVPTYAGFFIGRDVADRLPHQRFVWLVNILLIVSGVLAISKSLVG